MALTLFKRGVCFHLLDGKRIAELRILFFETEQLAKTLDGNKLTNIELTSLPHMYGERAARFISHAIVNV